MLKVSSRGHECMPPRRGGEAVLRRAGDRPPRVRVLARRGWAVQVDPIEPKLKLPGIKRLKLKCDESL
jgi:hypothetical protein